MHPPQIDRPGFRGQMRWRPAPYAKGCHYQVSDAGGWEWAVRRHKGKKVFRIYWSGNLQPGQFPDITSAKAQAEMILVEKLHQAALNLRLLGSSCGG
jgi:hypothetical protein